MAFVAVLDACVLVPHPLFDTLMRTAHAGLYEARWSEQILTEVERTLVRRLGHSPERASIRISAMRLAFPHAGVTGHEDLVDAMRNDPKDRHVLAAAVRAGAGAVVTANLKDFPRAALEPYGIDPLHPDDFLLDLMDLDGRQSSRCSPNSARRTSIRPCHSNACCSSSSRRCRGSPPPWHPSSTGDPLPPLGRAGCGTMSPLTDSDVDV